MWMSTPLTRTTNGVGPEPSAAADSGTTTRFITAYTTSPYH